MSMEITTNYSSYAAQSVAESMAKASGWTIVYQHSYIDENGNYHCRMQGRNDGMLKLSDKLREERKEVKEDGADGKVEEKSTPNKAEQLLNEKLAASKDGIIYLNDTDIRTISKIGLKGLTGKAFPILIKVKEEK